MDLDMDMNSDTNDDAGDVQSDKQVGTVKWYDSQKGYGFIAPESGGDDVFVHRNDLGATFITEDDKVEFEVKETPKGLAAINVSKIS